MHYADRLAEAISLRNTPAVVGIDPVLEKLPPRFRPTAPSAVEAAAAIERFSFAVIDAVADLVPAIKINSAFFEAFYEHGVAAYFRTIARAHQRGLLVIGDIKRGDIGSTSEFYARGHLAPPPFADVPAERLPDAVTLAGYFGFSVVAPFIEAAKKTGRGMYVLVRPSDPHSDQIHEFGGVRPLYWHMSELVKHWGAGADLIGKSGLSCVGAVVAGRDAAEAHTIRNNMPHTPFLVPGFGAQGAAAAAVSACFRRAGDGAIVNASRSVIYAIEQPRWKERCGDDAMLAVRLAAEEFATQARDMARAASQ
ncbi:MAG: orotidine-5'-phosphate decarboxylase [Phycisphaerae bacterium]|nr:orotidine-5'-phosphate decarboxylase [Phycisphaerae bacterium]